MNLLVFLSIFLHLLSIPPTFCQNFRTISTNISILNASQIEENLFNLGSPISDAQTLSFYEGLLSNSNMFGKWHTSGNNNDFFHETSGTANIKGSQIPDESQPDLTWDFIVEIYDGKYVDEKYIQIPVKIIDPLRNFTTMNFTNATFTILNFPTTITFGDYDQTSSKKVKCPSDISMAFYDLKSGAPLTDLSSENKRDFGFKFSLESPTCSLSFSTPMMINSYDIETSQLIVYLCVISFYMFFGTLAMKKTKSVLKKQKDGYKRISGWSLLLLNSWDAYFLIFHLVSAANLSVWFTLVSILLLFLVFGSETTLIYYLYLTPPLDNANMRKCFRFFVSYYLGLMASLYILFAFTNVWRNIIPALFLLPQIFMTISTQKRYKFNYWFEFGTAIFLSTWMVYAHLYPDNIFLYSPRPLFVGVFLGINVLQLIILKIQTQYPRFCFSNLPFKYTFVPANPEEKLDICPICIEPLRIEEASLSQKLLDRQSEFVKLVQTPCGHKFHDKCLKTWMNKKFECPFCKQKIPSISLEVGEQTL